MLPIHRKAIITIYTLFVMLISLSQNILGQNILTSKVTSSSHLFSTDNYYGHGFTGVQENHFIWDKIDHRESDVEFESIVISPNPTSNHIIIQSDYKSLLNITIINEIGRPVKSYEKIQVDQYLDISMLNSGIYIIYIETNNGQAIRAKKLIKI